MGEMVYIKVYKDFISIAEALDNGQRGKLFLAILQYANGQEPTGLSGAEYIAFLTIKAQIDRDQSEYASKSEKNRENGRKGGRPKKANGLEENRTVILKTQKSQDKEKDKDEEEEKDKELAPKPPKPKTERKFTPPTVEEVAAYCKESGYHIDYVRFVSYYTSNGWKVGKNPMKDWQAAVRTWASKDKQEGGNYGLSEPAAAGNRGGDRDAAWGIRATVGPDRV